MDTNIVVRLLLRDDPMQVALVDALVADGDLLVPLTVLVEVEWVLRGVYKLSRLAVSELLVALTAIDGIDFSDRIGVAWACDRHAAGADFADMIHLVAASESDAFLTFDAAIAHDAGETSPLSVVVPV